MSRLLKNGFLKEFCEFCSDTEVPSIFALWGGINLLSMALGRSCYLPFGHGRIYANLYTILVAGSAKCRKSTAISLVESLAQHIDPSLNMLSQKMSPESLIENLSKCPTEINGQSMSVRSEGHIVVDELATLIDQKAFQSGMIPLLTTLWDCKESFEYSTRTHGKEVLRNIYLTILGGSTIQWIKEAVPVAAIGGGFTSRVIFVFQNEPEKSIAFPEINPDNEERKKLLIRDLNVISKLHGKFSITDAAKLIYSKEYEDFRMNNPLMLDKNTSGYGGRRHIMLLKLAMILSASERDSLLIQEADITRSTKILEMIEKHLPKVMQAITSETVGDVCEEILLYVKQKKLVKRSELLSKFRHKLSSKDLQTVMETLIDMKVIVMEAISGDYTYVYRGK